MKVNNGSMHDLKNAITEAERTLEQFKKALEKLKQYYIDAVIKGNGDENER